MQLTHMLTEEQKILQETVRKFVDNEIMPIREDLEKDYSLVESVLQKLVDLGIQKDGYPPDCGGTGPFPPGLVSFLKGAAAPAKDGLS